MTESKDLAVLGGVLVLGSVMAFATAGYTSTWLVPVAIESVVASVVFLAWGIGILLYLSVRVVWSRIHSNHRNLSVPGRRLLTWRSVIALAVLSIILLSALFVVLYQETRLVACFGCGLHPVISTSPSCAVVNSSCEITLLNTGDGNAQAIACSFQSRGAPEGSNVTAQAPTIMGVLSYKTGGPAITITIPAAGSVVVYCSGYSGYLKSGAQVDGAVQTSDGFEDPFSTVWH